jgi:hypothetical protein
MALAPAPIIALKGCAGGAVTRAALGEDHTPVPGPPVPILVVMPCHSFPRVAGTSVSRRPGCESIALSLHISASRAQELGRKKGNVLEVAWYEPPP